MNEDPKQDTRLEINVVLKAQGTVQPETGDTIKFFLVFIGHAIACIYAAPKFYNLGKLSLSANQ